MIKRVRVRASSGCCGVGFQTLRVQVHLASFGSLKHGRVLLAVNTDRDKLLIVFADVESVLGAQVFSEAGEIALVA